MQEQISIDVYSDVVCPWCFVGKRRLRKALDLMPEVDATVRWRPFRLDSTIPPGGIPREEYLTNKFGPDQGREMYDRLIGMGDDEGIVFRFDDIERSPNTVDAHRLILWSDREGVEDEVVERLFTAYFSEGLDVGDRDILAEVAGEAGMEREAVRAQLDTDLDHDLTVAEIENAYRIGVNGVPAFIFDRKVVIMGAYPPETIVQAVEQAIAQRSGEEDGDD